MSVALSKEQYQALREAITNWRQVQTILTRMEKISRHAIFATVPDIRRHKPLTKRDLWLNPSSPVRA